MQTRHPWTVHPISPTRAEPARLCAPLLAPGSTTRLPQDRVTAAEGDYQAAFEASQIADDALDIAALASLSEVARVAVAA